MCVGGGTTINNALCLDPPGPVLDEWTERGIERAGLEAAIGEVRKRLAVRPIVDGAFSEAARRFAAGAKELNLPGRLEVMEANILPTCVGCGYCNIGCAFGAKLSMLDTMLPWGQQEFPGKLDVLADFEVTAIVHEGDKALGVRGLHDGATELFIGAETVVVSAGPVASSWLLQRSNIGGDRVGRGLHFNINSPLTAEFEDEVDAFAGIQMSHAYHPPGDVPGFLLENWFNPPATQALALPGWFGQHFELMRRYRCLASGGSLVGTTEPGLVRPGKDAPEIVYEPSRGDLKRVLEGMKLMGRIFLAAGAKRVMPPTFAWHEFSSAASLEALDDVVSDNADLLLTSAHPQGGNPVGERGQGVVGPDFRVHGFANLFLCDASAFPSSVRVNPQLTVMGLATYAADRILGPPTKPGNGHTASMATTSPRRRRTASS
jgi:choline dehydrogenase-like flavoprotein